MPFLDPVENFELEYFPPEPSMTALISTFYEFRHSGEPFRQYERADNAQLRFQLTGEGFYKSADGPAMPVHPVTVLGPTSRPRYAEATTPLHMFGFGLLPAGWHALVRLDGREWLDSSFDARLLLGDAVMDVWQALAAATDVTQRLAIARDYARTLFPVRERRQVAFLGIVSLWLNGSAAPEVDELLRLSGRSARQVERLTNRYFGVAPKQLARKYRALRAATLLADGAAFDTSDLALAFYDQSHPRDQGIRRGHTGSAAQRSTRPAPRQHEKAPPAGFARRSAGPGYLNPRSGPARDKVPAVQPEFAAPRAPDI